MKTLNEIAQAITSPAILDELVELIRSHDDTFPQEEATYQEAVARLKEIVPSAMVDEYIGACQTEVVANILYAAYEGYRANLLNFYSPCSTTFPRMDFTDYIRDHLIGHFPTAVEAYHIRDSFTKALPEAARGAEEAVSSYFTLLDVHGPKLAHYAGYELANRLLPWVVPGYREDYSQTAVYRCKLEKYIGHLPV